MNKTKTTNELVPSDTESPVISMTEISRDNGNGILVYKTNAEDGAGFTCAINWVDIPGIAKDGQVWFYAGQPLGESPSIQLK